MPAVFCHECKARLLPNAKFCSKCGTDIPSGQPAEQPRQVETSGFCARCGASFAASAENGGGFTVKKMYGDFKERLYGVWRTSGGGYIEWGDMGQFNSVRRDYIFEHYMEYAGDKNVSEDNTGYHVSLPEMTVHDEYAYEKYDLRIDPMSFSAPKFQKAENNEYSSNLYYTIFTPDSPVTLSTFTQYFYDPGELSYTSTYEVTYDTIQFIVFYYTDKNGEPKKNDDGTIEAYYNRNNSGSAKYIQNSTRDGVREQTIELGNYVKEQAEAEKSLHSSSGHPICIIGSLNGAASNTEDDSVT